MTHRPLQPASPMHAQFAARLRKQMELRAYTRGKFAELVGVTATQVGFWRAGRFLPSLRMLDRIEELLQDETLRNMVRAAKTGHCPCGATFDRGQTKRQYCSMRCQRRAHLKNGLKAPDSRQVAIDAMCRGCEPEGICRDDSCALRPHSPLLFVAFHRRSA